MPKGISVRQLGVWLIILLVAAGAGYAIIHVADSSGRPKASSSHIIELRSNGAEPSTIAVVKGSYVEFDTKDSRSHNIGEGTGHAAHTNMAVAGSHDSGIFGSGAGYRVTFREVGTYHFFDHLNPDISVTVIVYEPKHGK